MLLRFWFWLLLLDAPVARVGSAAAVVLLRFVAVVVTSKM